MIGNSIAPDALEGIAGFVEQARDNTRTAGGLVATALRQAQGAAGDASDSSLRFAYDHVQRAGTAADQAVKALGKLGVELPKQAGRKAAARTPRDPFDLSALAQMESPKMRKLLALLDEAQAVAEAIDAERGQVLPVDLPLLPGESRGTGYAEDVSMIAVRLRGEVHGQIVGRE